jgi:endonuclease-3
MAFFNNFPSDGPSTVAFDTQAANHHPDLGPALWLARRRRALRRQDLGVIIPFPKRKVTRSVALAELAVLEGTYPASVTALTYHSPFELLVAVILSAQCTDARVNLTTPVLFAAYPDAAALAGASIEDVERIVKSCGFFRMKAKNIVNAARALVEQHGGDVPREREALEALPGVGRKTAAVVLSVAFEDPAFAVDTHVFRVAHRLGLTLGKTPRAVEDDVTKLLPAAQWRHAHHWLILHGRAICKAPAPLCDICPVTMCPSRPLVAKARNASVRARRGAAAGAVRRPARSL